jgi:ribose transport system substrate-binding protein
LKKLKFILSLTTRDNDYQVEQAESAQETASRLGVELELLYAENDSILQSQQLLDRIQSKNELRPHGIIFEPVGGTALPQAAKAAAAAGIAWVVLNREVDYLSELRRSFQVPVFSISSDHKEIGRIQGCQVAALLPKGGSVLVIEGPTESLAARQRATGLSESKPIDVHVKVMKANWTELGAYKAASAWLKLSTSPHATIDLIAAQNDVMAMGARKAFQDVPNLEIREALLKKTFIGIDGVRKTGQRWVQQGQLTATIVVPTNALKALEMLKQSLENHILPAERTLTIPQSLPSIEELGKKSIQKGQAATAL